MSVSSMWGSKLLFTLFSSVPDRDRVQVACEAEGLEVEDLLSVTARKSMTPGVCRKKITGHLGLKIKKHEFLKGWGGRTQAVGP